MVLKKPTDPIPDISDFAPKRTWNWQFSDSEEFKKQEPVVIKEIDTHPTLLGTLGPYDTFANP